MKVKSESEVSQSCPTLNVHMNKADMAPTVTELKVYWKRYIKKLITNNIELYAVTAC